jgi:hypothetical protein
MSWLQAPRPAAFTSQQQRRGGRRSQRCFAAVEEEKKALDFTSNKNSVSGNVGDVATVAIGAGLPACSSFAAVRLDY